MNKIIDPGHSSILYCNEDYTATEGKLPDAASDVALPFMYSDQHQTKVHFWILYHYVISWKNAFCTNLIENDILDV